MNQEISETAASFQEQLEEMIVELKEDQQKKLIKRDQLNQELDLIEIQIDSYEDTLEQIKEFIQMIKG